MASAQAAQAASRRKTRRRNRNLWSAGAAVVVVGLIYFGWEKTHQPANPLGQMIVAPVTKGNLTETITATGSVDAQTGAQINIGSQITGTIKHLYVDVGGHVNAGQTIAVLDLPDMRAQTQQARASLGVAEASLQQQLLGVSQTHSQVSAAVAQAEAQLHSSEAAMIASNATANLQSVQVPTDIQKAQAAVSVAQAALNTAKSQQNQTDRSVALQIATSKEQLTQAKANATNSDLLLGRNKKLLAGGFVAQSAVDALQAQDTVSRSQVASAQQNILLVQQQVEAAKQSAADAVTQAQQNVASAQAALASAKAEPYMVTASRANAQSAAAAVRNAQASLQLAMGNRASDAVKAAAVAQAEQAVQVSKEQVIYYQDQLAKTVIRSPIEGTVIQLAEQQGETLAAGLSAPTLIVVANLKKLQIDAYVDETDIGKIKVGQTALCTIDAYPHHIIHGHVAKVAAGATILQGVITYDVTIALDHTNMRLLPSMTANVTIDVADHKNVLLVPSEAIHLEVSGASVNVVHTVAGKAIVVPTPVQIGGSDGINTEIKSGLKDHEAIELAGSALSSKPNRFGHNNSPFTSNKKKPAKKK